MWKGFPFVGIGLHRHRSTGVERVSLCWELICSSLVAGDDDNNNNKQDTYKRKGKKVFKINAKTEDVGLSEALNWIFDLQKMFAAFKVINTQITCFVF